MVENKGVINNVFRQVHNGRWGLPLVDLPHFYIGTPRTNDGHYFVIWKEV